jgi:hypothetical protein
MNPDSCQMHQHKTDHLTPQSSKTQILPDPTTALIAFTANKGRHHWNLISMSSASHKW